MAAAVVGIAVCWAAAAAQAPDPAQGPPEDTERLLLNRYFIPPNLIMEHQREIGLTAEQRRQVVESLRSAEGRFVELRWEIHRAVDQLVDMIRERRPEEEVLAQLDRVLDLEREMKRVRFSVAYRIRQALTDEQIARLQELRPLGPRRIQNRNRPLP
ncbi:MAG: hypothetical protein Kow00109_28820 [Acidobacteriota bacterium]